MFKKFVSVCAAVSILFGTCQSVFAAQVIEDTTSKTWKQTFEGIADNTAPDDMLMTALTTETTDETTGEVTVTSLPGVSTDGEMGKFGKNPDDTAFYMKESADENGTYNTSRIWVKNDAGSDNKTAIISGIQNLSADSIVHVSFDYAIDSYNATRNIRYIGRRDTKSAALAMTCGDMLKIDTAGAVSAFGSSTAYTMPIDKWVRYDYIMTDPKGTSGSTMYVFADGKQILQKTLTYPYKASSTKTYTIYIYGLATLEFGMTAGTLTANETVGTYLDNYSISIVNESPVLDEISLSHSDLSINGSIDNDTKTVSLPSSVTAENFISGANYEGIEVVDINGNEQTGNLSVGYIRIPYKDDYVYYTLNVYEQNFFFKENFQGKTITDSDALSEQSGIVTTAEVSTSDAVCGRVTGDTSLNVSAQTADALTWTAQEAIASETITLEASMMLQSGTADFGISLDSSKKSVAAFGADNKILVNGQDSGFTWRPNNWYKVAAVIDTASALWSVYVNGTMVLENADIDAELFTEGITAAEGISVDMAESTVMAIDDILIHSGEYVPGKDTIKIESISTDYIIDGDIIYIPEAVTVETFAVNMSLGENTVIGDIYTDSVHSQTKEENLIDDGNAVVLRTLTASVYRSFDIKITSDILGITAVTARYDLDNANRTVFAPAYTTAKSFYQQITLPAGHTGVLVDSEGNTLAEDDTIKYGQLDGIVYRVQYTNCVGTYSGDYSVDTIYVYETFDDLLDENIPAGSYYKDFLYNKQAVSGGTITAEGVKSPTDENENVIKLYSSPGSITGDAKITFRLNQLEKAQTTSPYVINFDIYTSDTKASDEIILKYTNYDGAEGNYYTIFSCNSSGGVVFAGETLANYKANEWNNIIIVVNPSGTSASKVYVNGKLEFNKAVGRFQKTIANIEEFIFTHGITSSERTTYMDNIKFYPIASVSAFDDSDMECTVSSEWDIIGSDNVISGYGPATAEQFIGLLSIPSAASYGLYEADGVTAVANAAMVTEGMKLIVTSGNGKYSSEYTLGKALIIGTPIIKIGERNMSYLIEGDVTGEVSVYSAIPKPMTLTLTYTDGTETKAVTAQRTAEDTGETVLTTEAAATVKNIEGEKITLALTDSETGELLAEEKLIEWTGRLDLSSEIMTVKNGANSIVTVTLDDGLVNTLNKCNSWFAQYGIKGTSVIWSDRAADSVSTYAGIFEKGYIDVASHSKTHANLSTMSGLTNETRLSELQGSQTELRNMFPDQEVITFAPSNNALDSVSDEMVSDYYWAVRKGQRGYNSLDPAESLSGGGWYNLKIQGVHNPQDMSGTACTVNDCLDVAAENPVWLIYMYHSIESKEGVGTLPVLDGVASSNFKKIGEMQDAGTIWVASLNEATKYIRERQHSSIEDIATETSRTVTVSLDAELPEDIFDYPLTVRSQVPEEWAKDGIYVKVTQGGRVQAPSVQNVDGGLYVYYDVIPSGVPAVLEAVTEAPQVTIDSIKISYEGALTQETGATSQVTFTASTVPVENTDLSGIEWYVNDVKQDIEKGTLTFSYQNEKIGTYNIQAKDSLTGLVSNIVAVTVKEAGLLFEDDFESYGNTDTLPSSKWYANTTVGLGEYYAGSGNHAAKVYYNENAKYPGLHKTVSLSAGNPTIYSGRLAQDGTLQSFFMDIRNSETNATDTAKTLLKIKGSDIFAISSDEAIAHIENGKWINYSIAVTPVAAGELTKIRITLSSPYLTDASGENEGQYVVYEAEVNLDDTAIAENGSANMVHNNDFSKANDTCFNYLDNVKIYNPQSAELMPPDEEFIIGNTLAVKINKDVFGFDTSMITVTDSEGNPVEAYVDFDSSNPRYMNFSFAEGVLKKNSVYTITLNGGTALIDALGNTVSATAQFNTSSLDTIEALSIVSEGNLSQSEDSMSAVIFNAEYAPSENVDISTIDWYVNGAKQTITGTQFTYTPEAQGTYEVYATAGTDVVSNKVTINVSQAVAASLQITSVGKLTQPVGNNSDVTFTASPLPEGSLLDETSVKWFLNGNEVSSGTVTYTFTPSDKGRYEVYAQIGDNVQSKSNVINCKVITPTVQEYLLNDDFESFGIAGTKITSDNLGDWSSVLQDDSKWAEISQDPENSNNLVAKFTGTGSSTQYPRVQKSGVAFESGKPFVISGKLYMPTASSQFVMNIGTNRKEVFNFNKNGIVKIDGVQEDSVQWQSGGWIWFSAYVTPGETAAQSTIRLVLGGNVTGTTVLERTVDLSVVTTDTCTVFYNTAVNPGSGDAIYLDDAKIYYPSDIVLDFETEPVVGENQMTVRFSHDIDPSSVIGVENVSVAAYDGKTSRTVTVESVSIDAVNPDKININLSETLADNVQYTISPVSILDNGGNTVTSKLTFGKVSDTFTVTDANFENITAESITAKVNVERCELLQNKNITVITAIYNQDGSLARMWIDEKDIEAGNGAYSVTSTNQIDVSTENCSFTMYIWDSIEGMMPLSEAVR